MKRELRDPLMQQIQTPEDKLLKKFSFPKIFLSIFKDATVYTTSYGYSWMLLVCTALLPKFKDAVSIAGGSIYFSLEDLTVVSSAITGNVFGFVGAQQFVELKQLRKETKKEAKREDVESQPLTSQSFPTVVNPSRSQQIQEKIKYISNLPAAGMRIATPFIIVSSGILAASSFVLPKMGLDPSAAQSFRVASLVSIGSLPIYAERFFSEQMYLAAGKKLHITLISLGGIGAGVGTVYLLCFNGLDLGLTGMTLGMLAENLFTWMAFKIGLRYMWDFEDFHFLNSYRSCGNEKIKQQTEQLGPLARSVGYTFTSEWWTNLARHGVASGISTVALASQNYVDVNLIVEFMNGNALGQAGALGLKTIIDEANDVGLGASHPMTLKLQSRYAHCGLLINGAVNGVLVIVVWNLPNLIAQWFNPDVSSDVTDEAGKIMPYGATFAWFYSLAIYMRQVQMAQVGQWDFEAFNIVLWSGVGASAIAAFPLGLGALGLNQATMLFGILSVLTLAPGYIKTFCLPRNPTTENLQSRDFSPVYNHIISPVVHAVTNCCSSLFRSIKRACCGEPVQIHIQAPKI